MFFSCILTPTGFWLVRLLYTMPAICRNCLYLILACVAKNGTCARIIPNLFGQNRPKQEQLHAFFLHFRSNMILASASVIPVPAIYKNCLYMILACVAKNGTCAWIIPNLFGQNRPKQVMLHVFSCIFAPTWFWLVRLLYHFRLYKRTAYTWFWLVWPKTRLVHELFQIFLARIDRNKNTYMYFPAFSLQHDCGLCGQKRDLCMNYSKSFWPG